MIVSNQLSRDISLTEARSRLDAACKRLLANKKILAWIMKYCMDEYSDGDLKEIEEQCIEGSPDVGEIAVHQDEENVERITTGDVELTSVKEGKVTFDIRFWARYPGMGERIRMNVDMEAQNNFYPGYPLVKRGIYYGGRMISSQYGTEFTNTHYENLKKVYSVFICMNPPKSRQNTITEYVICEKHRVGTVCEAKANYDLMTVIMICLGDYKATDSKLLGMLDVLLSTEYSAEEKKRILSNEFQIQMTKIQEMEVNQMCNYSEGVFDKGWNKGWNDGKEAVDKLNTCLKNDGRVDDLLRSIGDKEYQMQLMQEYGISCQVEEETKEKKQQIVMQ